MITQWNGVRRATCIALVLISIAAAFVLLSVSIRTILTPSTLAGPRATAPTLVMNANERGIGRRVPPSTQVTDLNGVRHSVRSLLENVDLLVIAVRDIGCPNSRKTGPALARIESEYASRRVRMAFLNLSPQDSVDSMRGEVSKYAFTGHYLVDHEHTLGRILDARSTTDVFVIDAAATLRYAGAINDQYGLGSTKPEPRHRFLRDALDALLEGRDPEIEATRAPGCLISMKQADSLIDLNHAMERTVVASTYHGEISRIVQRNCLDCHHADGMAPFSLETYDDVRGRSRMIQFVLDEGIMPPWPLTGGQGPWMHDRSLPSRDKSMLLDWIADNCPEGDPADAPLPRRFDDKWEIGEPDAVIQMPEPLHVPAEGFVDYQFVYVKSDFAQDRWVQGIEIRSEHRDAVHHLAVWVGNADRELDVASTFKGRHGGRFDQTGFLAIIVPGQGPTRFPDDTAKFLPAGSWLKFQFHYTPTGEELWDEPEVGLIFSDGPPRHELFTNVCIDRRMVVPAGAPDYEVTASFEFDVDAHIRAFHPHMHLRGKSFRYNLHYPNGESRELLRIDEWDFNWQYAYELISPVPVPAGSVLVATAIYDNSAANPRNPDPTVDVRFGQQATDEMMLGYFEWFRVRE